MGLQGKTFSCRDCGKADFTSPAAVRGHMSKVHGTSSFRAGDAAATSPQQQTESPRRETLPELLEHETSPADDEIALLNDLVARIQTELENQVLDQDAYNRVVWYLSSRYVVEAVEETNDETGDDPES